MLFRSGLILAAVASGCTAFQTPLRVAPSVMRSSVRLPSATSEEVDTTYFPPVEAKPVNGGAAAVAAPAPAAPEMSLVDTPAQGFASMVKKGETNAKTSTIKTLASAILGGCYVGMGGMLSLAVVGNSPTFAAANPGLAKFVFAALFPVNLLLVLQAGGQLFTGNTANMAAAVFEKKATLKDLARSWSLAWFGNLFACSMFALACKYSGVLSGSAGVYAAKTLAAKTSTALGPIIVKAMLCNWLVCLAVYLSSQARDMTGKYLAIWLPISTFVSIGFEHSVANMFLLPAGLLCSTGISIKTALLKNLIPVTIGNAISGALFVGGAFSFMFGRLGEGK